MKVLLMVLQSKLSTITFFWTKLISYLHKEEQ